MQASDVFSQLAFPFKHHVIQLLNGITSDDQIPLSDSCRHQLVEFANGLQNNTLSSHAMIDSFSKVASGVIHRQGIDLGAYSQCLNYGRYVMLGLHFPLPNDTNIYRLPLHPSEKDARTVIIDKNADWRIKLSEMAGFLRWTPYLLPICLPHECMRKDIETVLKTERLTSAVYPLSLSVVHDESFSDGFSPSFKQILCLIPFLIVIILVSTATVSNQLSPDSHVSRRLRSFDAVANTLDLFRESSSDDKLLALNICKFYAILGPLIGHSAVVSQDKVFAQPYMNIEWINQGVLFSPIKFFASATPCFILFGILLSSFLSTLIWLPIFRKTKISFFQFLTVRVLRMWPLMIAFILFTQTFPLIPHGGPMMTLMQESMAEKCSRNWWKEMLFVQNLFGDEMLECCMVFGWSLSADVQLYILSFLTLTVLARNKPLGIKMIFAQIIIGMFLSGYRFMETGLAAVFDLQVMTVHTIVKTYRERMDHTIWHIPVFAIGTLAGVSVLDRDQRKGNTTTGFTQLATAILTLLFNPFLIAFLYDGWMFRFSYSLEVVFNATARTIQSALAGFYVYIVFFKEPNEQFRAIFKSRPVLAINRMGLSVLVTCFFVYNFAYTTFESFRVSLLFATMFGLFTAVATLIVAYAAYILIEKPFANLLMPKRTNQNSVAAKKSI